MNIQSSLCMNRRFLSPSTKLKHFRTIFTRSTNRDMGLASQKSYSFVTYSLLVYSAAASCMIITVAINTEKDRKGPKETEKDRIGPKRTEKTPKRTEKTPKRTEKQPKRTLVITITTCT